MKNLQNYGIVAHVHDEVICEVPEKVSVEEICKIMALPPDWMPELNLKAEGFESAFYKK